MPAVTAVRDLIEAGRLWQRRKRDPRLVPWHNAHPSFLKAPRACIICGWTGTPFMGSAHCESATCPRCGSIARDRFVFYCLVQRVNYRPGLRLLETSPRLGNEYRQAMSEPFMYLTSDFDYKAHRGDVVLDLQALGLRDASLDVVVTAHVLEHVPDTGAALAELWRVLAPGGTALVAVPVLQGLTTPPSEPEFHEDNTPVFWRFGFDLTERLRTQGFKSSVLVTAEFKRLIGTAAPLPPASPEFDLPSIVRGGIAADMVAVANDSASRLQGFVPPYMFVVWECVKPR